MKQFLSLFLLISSHSATYANGQCVDFSGNYKCHLPGLERDTQFSVKLEHTYKQLKIFKSEEGIGYDESEFSLDGQTHLFMDDLSAKATCENTSILIEVFSNKDVLFKTEYKKTPEGFVTYFNGEEAEICLDVGFE